MNTNFARRQMVDQQVRAWDVLDATTLAVLRDVPREQFVPSGFESMAFADTEIPIGRGQFMMTPTVEGRLLQALALKSEDRVLEVGTGSGFLTACMAHLAKSVTSIDVFDEFLQAAAMNLEDSGLTDVELIAMDAMQQLPDGEFDAIVVSGSLPKFDLRLAMPLKPGGRMFIVIGDAPVMDARLVRRKGENDWHTESLFETELTPLVNGSLPPQFSF